MDCADRISMQGAELDLRRVRRLRAADSDSVEVVVFSRRRRFGVTIRAEARGGAPSYAWSAVELAASGGPQPGGVRLSEPEAARGAEQDPEEAYWAAVEAIARLEDSAAPAELGPDLLQVDHGSTRARSSPSK